MRLQKLLATMYPGSTRQSRHKRGTRHASRIKLDELETRVVPSTLPPPNPIDPTRGESNLLRVVQMMADKQNLNAQDHFPVPYTIVVSAGGAAPTVKNWKAGAPIKLDADQSKLTGQGGGGNDIQVQVNTDSYTNSSGQPDWRLRLNVERLGTGNYAQNLNLVISFPWDAFNTETTLSAAPNLMMGFQTRLAGTPGTVSYITGTDGGIMPLSMEMVITPHILAGTAHEFEWDILTTGASNPITFMSGEFEGNPGTNTIVNALGWQAYVQNVPSQIAAQVKVNENALGSAAVDSTMDFSWQSSSTSLTAFDYFEAESAGAASAPTTANYATQIVADTMPTNEHFVMRQNEAAGTFTLNHEANSSTREMTFLKRRSDGLALTGVAADDNPALDAVPSHVDLTLGLRGYQTIDVNANTLDLSLQATQVGGFNNTSQFFENYDLEYVALKVKNAPDQTADFDGATKTYTMLVTNTGEVAPFSEMVLDDNGRISPTNVPLNLELPEKYAVVPAWDLWSITDDGSHGTAVARALDVQRLLGGDYLGSATFNHYAPDIKETVELQTVAPHPMQTYLRTGLLSAVQPPIPPGAFWPFPSTPFIEVEGHIEDVPSGHTRVTLDFPLTVEIHSDSKIAEICMAGHIGFLNFALVLLDNPTNSKFDFRPEGSVEVQALDNSNNPDFFTGSMAVLYDVTGFDPAIIPLPVDDDGSVSGFHSSAETFFPNNTRLKEAHLRLDHVPSFKATWDNDPNHTYIDMATVFGGEFAYVDGVQLKISTKTTLEGTTLTCDYAKTDMPAATDTSEHYALLKDVAGEQTLEVGIFGVDSFHFASDDTVSPSKFTVDWELDPARPYTAAHMNVDTHPTTTGALGSFFGGSTVTGPLDVGYIPPTFHLASEFDPTVSTATFFPGGLPIPNVISQMFVVDGTQIYVYAQGIPKVFSVTWNITNPTTTLAVTAQDNLGNPDKVQLVEVLFLNPNGLPGGDALFNDAANPLQELRVRADDIPSVAANWSTAGNPHVNIDTVAASGPFQYIGGLRISANTVAGSTVLPTFPVPTPGDDHYLRLKDVGATKSVEIGAFGLDNVDVLVNNTTSQSTITYNGDSERKFKAMISSNAAGRFFNGHTVDAGLVIDDLPRSIALTLGAQGKNLSYTANSTGQISSIVLGGSDLVDPAFNPSVQPSGTYDNVLIDVAAYNLPNIFGYAFDPAGSLSLTANNTPAVLPDRVGLVTAWLRSTTGIPGTSSILGTALKDARVRLDDVPGLTGNWTSAGGTTSYSLDTTGTNVYLGGAQVGLSTRFADVAPFGAPIAGAGQSFTVQDRNLGGPVARLSAALFGLENVNFTYVKDPAKLTVHYEADVARRLDLRLDTQFGSTLSGGSDVNATVTVDQVPALWDLTTDMKKNFKHHASSTIQAIDINAVIDDSNDSVNNADTLVARIRVLPTDLEIVQDKVEESKDEAAKTETTTKTTFIHASGAVQEIFFEETRDLPSGANRPSWTLLQINQFPGKLDMVDKTVTDVTDPNNKKKTKTKDVTVTNPADVPTPLPFVRIVSSVDSKATTLANHLGAFTGISGGLVHRTPFQETIDNRYYPGGVQGRLNDIYDSSPALDSPGGQLQDHVVTRQFGELTIPGVTVNLTGTANQSTTTNADGLFAFGGLAPGVYQIAETQPAGVTEGKTNPPGTLGGTAGVNTFSNITVGTFQDPDNNPITQTGSRYNFGERSLPNPGLAAGPGQPDPNAPGTLSGHVFLDENDDGLYQAGNLVDYSDLQMTNFQSLHTLEAPGGIQHIELNVPGNAPHPFFFGAADRTEFTIAKVENLPSSVIVDIKEKEHVYLDTSTSAGRVDLYIGPIGGANTGADATRAILLGAPTSVHMDYKDVAEFPGGAAFTASSEFEALILSQDSSNRFVGGLRMQELQLGYGFGFDPEITYSFPITANLILFSANAGIDNDTADSNIAANPNKPGVDGFFSVYEMTTGSDLKDLTPAGPGHGDREYTPLLTMMLKDFREFSITVDVGVELAPSFLSPLFDVTPIFDGLITIDYWAPEVDLVADAIVVEFGFLNVWDYSDNTPIHLIPFDDMQFDHLYDIVYTFVGFHSFDDHFDPYSPMNAAFAPPPGSSPALNLTANMLTPLVDEALVRWQRNGVSAERLEAARALRFEITDLPGLTLGEYSPGLIQIDSNAAGWGWFVDRTPSADEEFGRRSHGRAARQMDLLTVLSHEMGHALGFEHTDATGHESMSASLLPGVRLVDGAAIPTTATRRNAVSLLRTTAFDQLAGLGLVGNFISPLGLAPILDRQSGRADRLTTLPTLFERNRSTTLLTSMNDVMGLYGAGLTKSKPAAGLISLFAQRPLDELLQEELAAV